MRGSAWSTEDRQVIEVTEVDMGVKELKPFYGEHVFF